MDDIPSVEDIVGTNILKYDIDLIDGAMVGELARTKHQRVREESSVDTIS